MGMPGDTIEVEAEGYIPDGHGQAVSRKLVLPRQGRAYRLDEYSLLFCRDAILQETGGQAKFRNGKLYMDGRETSFFFFAQDYYWLLSDNSEAAVDSRYLGIIPADHLVGVVFFCWFSTDRNRMFTQIH
jgi:signal peptidase I